MKSDFVEQVKNRVEIKVEFEAAEFDAELKKVLGDISKRANIPGFRKGHAPRKTIEMRFGRAAIYDETVENLLNASIEKLIEDYDLEPLMAPQVKSRGNIVEGQPIEVNLMFENRPEINLPELEEIEVERLITALDDTQVEEMVQNILKSNSTHEAVDESVGEKSIVTIEYIVSIAKQPPEKATISMEEPPSKEFHDALLGKKSGDDVVVDIENPNPEAKEDQKTIRYDVKIIEVGKRVPPEMTPEFLKKVTGKDCANEEEFRSNVAEKILDRMQEQAERDAENRAIAAVSDKAPFDVPAILIHREIEAIKSNDERDAKERYKTDLDGLLKMRGMAREDYDKQVMMRAWSSVRTSLILDELGKHLEIKMEPADLDTWINERAARDGIDPKLMRDAYYSSREAVNMLADRVVTDKTVKALMQKIKIKDVSELTPPAPHEEEHKEEEKEEE